MTTTNIVLLITNTFFWIALYITYRWSVKMYDHLSERNRILASDNEYTKKKYAELIEQQKEWIKALVDTYYELNPEAMYYMKEDVLNWIANKPRTKDAIYSQIKSNSRDYILLDIGHLDYVLEGLMEGKYITQDDNGLYYLTQKGEYYRHDD